MAGSLISILKEKFPSKDAKLRKLESLRDSLVGTPAEKAEFNSSVDAAYRDGVWDALTQVIMMVKEGEL